MKTKNWCVAFLFILFFEGLCHCQNMTDGTTTPPTKVEVKFDSLFPHAYNINWHLRQKDEKIQVVTFDCNCQEGLEPMTITFDMSGNIVRKDIRISKNDLPATVSSYITNNYPNGFIYGDVIKINDDGVLSYTVILLQASPAGEPVSGGWTYILKFKASGEFITLDKK
jgi:hypothetical protein